MRGLRRGRVGGWRASAGRASEPGAIRAVVPGQRLGWGPSESRWQTSERSRSLVRALARYTERAAILGKGRWFGRGSVTPSAEDRRGGVGALAVAFRDAATPSIGEQSSSMSLNSTACRCAQ